MRWRRSLLPWLLWGTCLVLTAIALVFLVVGLGGAGGQSLLGYATYALLTEPGGLPGGAFAGLLADVLWWPTLVGGLVVMFALFPTGRLMSRRWRWLGYLFAADATAYMAATAVNGDGLAYSPAVPNPAGIANPVTRTLVGTTGPGLIVLLGAGVLALGMRYRRSHGAQRLQAFGKRLRQEIDLDPLAENLRRVVRNTMQPTHISLWLREVGR